MAKPKSYKKKLPKYPDGGKTPLYVTNPRDPRLRAYQDSLIAYNNDINFDKAFVEAAKKAKSREEIQKKRNELNIKYPLNNVKPAWEVSVDKAKTLYDNKDIGYKAKDMMGFKKPVRPVIYNKPILNKPAVIESNDMNIIRPTSVGTYESAEPIMNITDVNYDYSTPGEINANQNWAPWPGYGYQEMSNRKGYTTKPVEGGQELYDDKGRLLGRQMIPYKGAAPVTEILRGQYKHGGYTHNNMAGKINKRKGLPSRFPMYETGGFDYTSLIAPTTILMSSMYRPKNKYESLYNNVNLLNVPFKTYNEEVKAAEGQYLEYGGLMHFANGGRMVNPYNGMPNAEIEGEVVNHANGGIQDFTHLPNHEQATEANEMMLEPNTFVFSKRFNNPMTGRPFATDAKKYTTAKEERIFDDKNAPAVTSKSAKLMFGVKKQLAQNLAELHEATKLHNNAQKAENEATEEFIGMLGGMYGKGGLIKRKDGSYSPRGLWDNIRANRGSGKKPTKAMLEQERKIKAKYADGGTYLTAGDEYHRIYKNAEGDIMVNHPKEDKGKWDTINLTDKSGAKTVAQGVAATKKWHRENPKYESGGYALGESYDMTDEEIEELKKQGYTFDFE